MLPNKCRVTAGQLSLFGAGIVFFLFLVSPEIAIAKHKVRGTVTWKISGEPVVGAKVEAWDSDNGADDFMESDLTNSQGAYLINYEGKHWDPSPSHRLTWWRPDIYIRVKLNVDGVWREAFRSKIHSNHVISNDLTINAKIEPLPRVVGKVTRDGEPVAFVTVEAKDSDSTSPDDYMGSAQTAGDGRYVIPFARKDWEGGPGKSPDIYVEVFRNDDRLGSSTVWSNASMFGDTEINVALGGGEQANPQPAQLVEVSLRRVAGDTPDDWCKGTVTLSGSTTASGTSGGVTNFAKTFSEDLLPSEFTTSGTVTTWWCFYKHLELNIKPGDWSFNYVWAHSTNMGSCTKTIPMAPAELNRVNFTSGLTGCETGRTYPQPLP